MVWISALLLSRKGFLQGDTPCINTPHFRGVTRGFVEAILISAFFVRMIWVCVHPQQKIKVRERVNNACVQDLVRTQTCIPLVVLVACNALGVTT